MEFIQYFEALRQRLQDVRIDDPLPYVFLENEENQSQAYYNMNQSEIKKNKLCAFFKFIFSLPFKENLPSY